MVFPAVTYGCESWTVKKAEHRRIDAFELWCLRLLRVSWTTRRSNQSILKEISPGYSLEGLMLKLKLQYFSHLMRRVDSLEKSLMLGGDWGQEEKGMTAGSQHRSPHPWQGHAGELWWARRVRARGGLPPGPAWVSAPKPKSVCFTILRLSPTLLTLTGGYPRPPFSVRKST